MRSTVSPGSYLPHSGVQESDQLLSQTVAFTPRSGLRSILMQSLWVPLILTPTSHSSEVGSHTHTHSLALRTFLYSLGDELDRCGRWSDSSFTTAIFKCLSVYFSKNTCKLGTSVNSCLPSVGTFQEQRVCCLDSVACSPKKTHSSRTSKPDVLDLTNQHGL